MMNNMTLAGFMTHLTTTLAMAEREGHKAMEQAAKVIQAEAKAEIGTYQGAAPPFAAWAPLAESTKADRVAKGFSADDPLLRTGEMRDSIDIAVSHKAAAIGSNSEVAVYQELGTKNIPPRSFLGGAAVRKTEEVVRILGAAPIRALVGAAMVRRVMKLP